MFDYKDDENLGCCDEILPHKELIEKVKEKMPCDENLYELSELFSVFGDSTRIKILYLLFESELCVCDIAEILNMNQSAISHQLKILKNTKLISNRRAGKSIIYFLNDDHVREIINCGISHINE